MNISHEDLLQLEVFSLRKRVLDLEAQLHGLSIAERYSLKEGDSVDTDGKIVRAVTEK